MPAKGFNKRQDEFEGNVRARMNWLMDDLKNARIALDNAQAHGAQARAIIVAMAFIGSAERRIRNEIRSTERIKQNV